MQIQAPRRSVHVLFSYIQVTAKVMSYLLYLPSLVTSADNLKVTNHKIMDNKIHVFLINDQTTIT